MLAIDIARKLYEGRIPQNLPMDSLPYQDDAVAKLLTHRRHILGYPMGSGKSVIATRALEAWNPRRSLIIATDRAILSWLKAMWCWYPHMLERYAVISKGYKNEVRTKFYTDNRKHKGLSVITNWQLIQRDWKACGDDFPTEWDSIITDEHHKFMRNRDTGSHKMLKKMRSSNMLFVTGSPMSKGAQDLFVPLNIIDPKLFSSYWRFVSQWCHVEESPFGKKAVGTKNLDNFIKYVRNPHALIATKKELGLQKKLRSIVEVQMTPDQSAAYEAIRDDFLLELEDGPPIILLNTLAQYTKLRQVMACPAILSPDLGVGGSALQVQETLLDLPIEERHSVIFTPYRAGVPILKAFFEGKGSSVGLSDNGINLGIPVYTFTGGKGMAELMDDLVKFKQHGGLAICTTQYAESFDMETTDKAFMVGYDWDPQVNFQAEDRLDRTNNLHGLINIYYMMLQGTLDEDVLYALIMKQTNVNQLYSNRAVMREALGGH